MTGGQLLHGGIRDARLALRAMAARKTFTLAALVTLALGIGATTAIFSVFYGVLLRPLPYPEPERLVRLAEEHPGGTGAVTQAVLSDWTLEAWRESMRTIESVAAYGDLTYTVGREAPERMRGASVSPSLFSLLRAKPAAGRFFSESEALHGSSDVVVLSHSLWRERFQASSAALGNTLVIDEKPRLIVGVAPEGFAFPHPGARLWTPYVLPPKPANPAERGMRVFSAIARLAPGASPGQAEAEGTAAARSVPRPFVAELLFGKGGPVQVRVRSVVEEMTRELRPALQVLAVGVGLLFILACANVASLLLTRGVARRRELAIRAALGAGRLRLARQLLVESGLLALLGSVLGGALAWALVRLLPAAAPESFPRLHEVRLDGPVLLFAAGAAVAAGVLSGVLPALRGSGVDLATALQEGDGRSTAGAGGRALGGLLAAEAGLAVMLLVVAMLLGRSFARRIQVDAGFDTSNVVTAQVLLPEDLSATLASAATEQLLARARALPGVVAVGGGNMAPLGRVTAVGGFELPDGGPDGRPVVARTTHWTVTPGYAEALGLRLKAGRFFDQGDVGASTQAVLVNEEFVRQYWPGGRPVVRRRYPGLLHRKGTVAEIVGIVGNVLKDSLERAPQPELFVPAGTAERRLPNQFFLAVRTTGDPVPIVPELRRLVREVEPRAAVDGVGTLGTKLWASVAQPRLAASLLAGFAAVALSLAAVGLYGVLSYVVSERRREIGVRLALGAGRGDIVRLVMRRGLTATAAGLALGLAGAAALARSMDHVLFGVAPLDVPSFAAATSILGLVALAACALPARRAARTAPAEALRTE